MGHPRPHPRTQGRVSGQWLPGWPEDHEDELVLGHRSSGRRVTGRHIPAPVTTSLYGQPSWLADPQAGLVAFIVPDLPPPDLLPGRKGIPFCFCLKKEAS